MILILVSAFLIIVPVSVAFDVTVEILHFLLHSLYRLIKDQKQNEPTFFGTLFIHKQSDHWHNIGSGKEKSITTKTSGKVLKYTMILFFFFFVNYLC